MKDPELLCLGCMEEMEHPGGTCPKCGFNRSVYEKDRNVHTLPSYTILAGKYLLGRVLGEGGFGITYIAWDLNRERRVAVKEYFPSGLATRDARMEEGESLTILPGEKAAFYRSGLQSFAEEGKNLLRFQHLPGIVSVRDFFQDNRTAYIVMDFVEGQTLKQYLQKYYQRYGDIKPMDETFVLEMMKPLLVSLSKIHKAGIIHRDISPENIIYGPDGKVTLIDFGAARAATGTETRSLTVVLKHGYAPPEQYLSHGRQGPWTDIYAICATMYHMLTGRLPAESVDRMMEDRVPPVRDINPAVSERVSDMIQKGMSLRLQDRYQSVEEMEELLYPEIEAADEEVGVPDEEPDARDREADVSDEEPDAPDRETDIPKEDSRAPETAGEVPADVREKAKNRKWTADWAAICILAVIVLGSFVLGRYKWTNSETFWIKQSLYNVSRAGKNVLWWGMLVSGVALVAGRSIHARFDRIGRKMNVAFSEGVLLLLCACECLLVWFAVSWATGLTRMLPYMIAYPIDGVGGVVRGLLYGIAAVPLACREIKRKEGRSYVRLWCAVEARVLVLLVLETALQMVIL